MKDNKVHEHDVCVYANSAQWRRNLGSLITTALSSTRHHKNKQDTHTHTHTYIMCSSVQHAPHATARRYQAPDVPCHAKRSIASSNCPLTGAAPERGITLPAAHETGRRGAHTPGDVWATDADSLISMRDITAIPPKPFIVVVVVVVVVVEVAF